MQPELQYLEQEVRFFQLWALTTDLGLVSTLFSVVGSSQEEIARPRLNVTAPTTKISHSLRSQGPRVVKDSFIVWDGAEDERFLGDSRRNAFQHNSLSSVDDQEKDGLRFRLNWETIFQYVFGLKDLQDERFDDGIESPEEPPRIEELLDRVSSHIQEGIRKERLKSNTL
jgi:RNA polymerase I-specific transcription initiation factor RRN6